MHSWIAQNSPIHVLDQVSTEVVTCTDASPCFALKFFVGSNGFLVVNVFFEAVLLYKSLLYFESNESWSLCCMFEHL